MRVADGCPKIHIFDVLRLFHLALLVAATSFSGCGGAAVSRAKPPAPAGAQSIRMQKARARPPKLIAPPPAWGNKIVMAGRDGQTATN